MRRRPRVFLDHARRLDRESPQPRRLGLGDIKGLLVRREADAVWRHHRVGNLGDRGAVALGVIHRADTLVAAPPLAEIGEVDAALRIDDEVVRSLQGHVAAGAVEAFDGAGLEIDAFETPTTVILGLRQWPDMAAFAVPFEAAIVGDVTLAVGPDCGAVR